MKMPARIKLGNEIWLLAGLLLAIAPHAMRLPIWLTLLCAGIAGLRLVSARPPARWLLLVLAGAATAGIFFDYRTLLGRDAGVALLAVMLCLKMLEARTLRDNLWVIFLGYFLVITHLLYSQSIPTGLYLLLVVLVLTAALIGLNHPGGPIAPRKRLGLAAVLLGQAVPVMLVLFLFFPRVTGPLWGMPGDAYAGMTGLSDSMSPGSISKLIQSGAVAFRVTFDGPSPKPEQLYWRGPVLDFFDGRTWSPGTQPSPKRITLAVSGERFPYTLTLEPHNKRWLLALDLPAELPPASQLDGRFELLADAPVRQRLRYRAVSHPTYVAGLELDPLDKKRALRLPFAGNPKARAMGEELQKIGDPVEVLRRALAYYRDSGFVYTLTPPRLGTHVVDEFLFESRSGFCEHFASSFVYLMRAAGVPARVVTGYQGGETNPLGRYLIVRQSDAHAWAEVWLAGRGWVRVDPTAAASPRRIESGIASALPEGVALPLMVRVDIAWLNELRMSWDTLNNHWNQWVLGYGEERQYDFLSRLGFELASWKELAAGLAVGVGSLLLAFSGFMLWRRPRHAEDPASTAYRHFCRKLSRAGIIRRADEGPTDFARRIAEARPDLAVEVEAISTLYIGLRYAAQPAAADLAQLKRRIRALSISRQ